MALGPRHRLPGAALAPRDPTIGPHPEVTVGMAEDGPHELAGKPGPHRVRAPETASDLLVQSDRAHPQGPCGVDEGVRRPAGRESLLGGDDVPLLGVAVQEALARRHPEIARGIDRQGPRLGTARKDRRLVVKVRYPLRKRPQMTHRADPERAGAVARDGKDLLVAETSARLPPSVGMQRADSASITDEDRPIPVCPQSRRTGLGSDPEEAGTVLQDGVDGEVVESLFRGKGPEGEPSLRIAATGCAAEPGAEEETEENGDPPMHDLVGEARRRRQLLRRPAIRSLTTARSLFESIGFSSRRLGMSDTNAAACSVKTPPVRKMIASASPCDRVLSQAWNSIPETSGIIRSHKITSNRSPLSNFAFATSALVTAMTSCSAARRRSMARPIIGSSSTRSTRPRPAFIGASTAPRGAHASDGAAGRKTRKVDPFPGTLSTSISPPSDWTMD